MTYIQVSFFHENALSSFLNFLPSLIPRCFMHVTNVYTRLTHCICWVSRNSKTDRRIRRAIGTIGSSERQDLCKFGISITFVHKRSMHNRPVRVCNMYTNRVRSANKSLIAWKHFIDKSEVGYNDSRNRIYLVRTNENFIGKIIRHQECRFIKEIATLLWVISSPWNFMSCVKEGTDLYRKAKASRTITQCTYGFPHPYVALNNSMHDMGVYAHNHVCEIIVLVVR